MDHVSAADLAAVPLFADLPDSFLSAIAERFEVERHQPGHTIVAEGRAGYSFYVLAASTATVTRDGQVLRTLGVGDFFGEIAILGPQGRRTATVTADDDVVVWELFGTSFRTLQMESPDVAQALEQAMRARLAAG